MDQTDSLQCDPRATFPSYQVGKYVFDLTQFGKTIPQAAIANWLIARKGKGSLDREYFSFFAAAFKEWALSLGALHYSHWCESLGQFVQFPLHLLNGETLFQSTFSGKSFRWDPSRLPFLWEEAEDLVLRIPSLYESHDQNQTVLLAIQKIEAIAPRLFRCGAIQAKSIEVCATVQQECVVLRQDFVAKHPDLSALGHSIYPFPLEVGRPSIEQLFSFSRDVERSAALLGISLHSHAWDANRIRHTFSLQRTQLYEAVQRERILRELIVQKATSHELVCLFHEKPFFDLPASSKYCEWSLWSEGISLFDVDRSSVSFLLCFTAICRIFHEHVDLLRCSIGSLSNDMGLKGSTRAVPALLIDPTLEELAYELLKGPIPAEKLKKLLFSYVQRPPSNRPEIPAFFKLTPFGVLCSAIGSSQSIAWPFCVWTALIADQLRLLLDELEDGLQTAEKTSSFDAIIPIVSKTLQTSNPFRFASSSFFQNIAEEREEREVPYFEASFHSFFSLQRASNGHIFEGILSFSQLQKRFEHLIKSYALELQAQCQWMIELFFIRIFPEAQTLQGRWAHTLVQLQACRIVSEPQRSLFMQFCQFFDASIMAIQELDLLLKQTEDMGLEAKAKVLSELVLPRMEKARGVVGQLEAFFHRRGRSIQGENGQGYV